MNKYTITFTKDELIECAEALHNQGVHLRKQFKLTNIPTYIKRSYMDLELADKLINETHEDYMFREQFLSEEHSS